MKALIKFLCTLLVIFCLLAMVGASLFIFDYFLEYREGCTTYSDIVEHSLQVIESVEPDSSMSSDKRMPQVDFDYLLSVNPDVIGWILIPGTEINYPIVYRSNDNTYYLSHLFDGSPNRSGTIFLDTRCSFQDRNMLIHGHHMGDGTMFRDLVLFKNKEFFDSHPYYLIIVPEQVFVVQVFAGSVQRIDSPVWQLDFRDSIDFSRWIDLCLNSASVTRPVLPSLDSQVVTLSTCTYEYKQARWILQGMLQLWEEIDADTQEQILKDIAAAQVPND